jgi:hypothetical protein
MAESTTDYKISTWRIFFRVGNVGNIYVVELHKEAEVQIYHDRLLSIEGMMTMVFANSETHDKSRGFPDPVWHDMGTAGGPEALNLLKQNAQMHYLSELETTQHPKDIILKVENRVVNIV